MLKKFIVQFYFIDREDHHKYKTMKINNHFLVGLALILTGCGSGSSESGSNDISCSNLKIFDGDLYTFSKGEVEYFRSAEPEDYDKFCEINELPK